jgi:hypothetical protein
MLLLHNTNAYTTAGSKQNYTTTSGHAGPRLSWPQTPLHRSVCRTPVWPTATRPPIACTPVTREPAQAPPTLTATATATYTACTKMQTCRSSDSPSFDLSALKMLRHKLVICAETHENSTWNHAQNFNEPAAPAWNSQSVAPQREQLRVRS